MSPTAISARNEVSRPWLCIYTYEYIFSFLESKDLAKIERVCQVWRKLIKEGSSWKIQCQIQLGLSSEIDPKQYLPESPSYKNSLELLFANVLDERVYKLYIGEVDPAPPIPQEISLRKWNQPDPCDLTKKIGTEYVWMYYPSYIEADLEGFCLDKPDDPNDPEAPKLIRKSANLKEESDKKTLKVPVTIYNIAKLFEFPKQGNSSTSNMSKEIELQHAHKRIPKGWICMRKDMVGRNLTFAQQQQLVKEKGVVLSELFARILFNFIQQVRSQNIHVYPDGANPVTYARTSTPMKGSEENLERTSFCGHGDSFGLYVSQYGDCANPRIGIAVELPVKTQAINP